MRPTQIFEVKLFDPNYVIGFSIFFTNVSMDNSGWGEDANEKVKQREFSLELFASFRSEEEEKKH